MVNDFETVFMFTAVTPVQSDAAWLLACCRSEVFFYCIMEAALGGANIYLFVPSLHISTEIQ